MVNQIFDKKNGEIRVMNIRPLHDRVVIERLEEELLSKKPLLSGEDDSLDEEDGDAFTVA